MLIEPEAGYLLARRACEHIVERVIAEGGTYREQAVASPIRIGGRGLLELKVTSGDALAGDLYVFACGPWLGSLFPDVVGPTVTPTRQEVFYFGTPAGDSRFGEDAFPVWVEVGARLMYGIPGNAHRGFKIGDDTPGPRIDPTHGERTVTPAALKIVRRHLSRRFPALARAPLIGAEVCQYEASPDAHFIIDRHPAAPNVWIVGGGSGHGFKMGPALGEMMAGLVLDDASPDPAFSLARFGRRRTRPAGGDEKWS
jgi:glycine/D-amino acid oxidase-like deaminating enzyme